MSRNFKNKWEAFQRNLKRYRKEKAISQTEMASKLNVKSSTISNYESGVSSPDLDTFVQIVKILGVSPSRLLGLNEYITEEDQVTYIEEPGHKFRPELCSECELRERIIAQQDKVIGTLENRIKDLVKFQKTPNSNTN